MISTHDISVGGTGRPLVGYNQAGWCYSGVEMEICCETVAWHPGGIFSLAPVLSRPFVWKVKSRGVSDLKAIRFPNDDF